MGKWFAPRLMKAELTDERNFRYFLLNVNPGSLGLSLASLKLQRPPRRRLIELPLCPAHFFALFDYLTFGHFFSKPTM